MTSERQTDGRKKLLNLSSLSSLTSPQRWGAARWSKVRDALHSTACVAGSHSAAMAPRVSEGNEKFCQEQIGEFSQRRRARNDDDDKGRMHPLRSRLTLRLTGAHPFH